MAQDISVKGFEGIVNNITANNYFTFTEEEIPIEGRGHNRAVHVSIKCMDHIMAKVLIDNGSSLKVMPKSTLEKVSFNASHMKPSSMVVRAFDGSHREVRGEINLPFQIGPHTYQVTFQVMDINLAYSCLLGQPWIHSVGVVSSMLHQKLKFVVEGHLVIISGEEDVLVSCHSFMPYVEAAKESLETAFLSFEVVTNTFVEFLLMRPQMSGVTMMVARVMLGHDYEPEMGLGKNNDGMANLVDINENRGKFRLGYKPTRTNVRRSIVERMNKGVGPQLRPQAREDPSCHISKSFVSAGLRHEEQVAMIHDEAPQERSVWVQSCLPDLQLGNLQVVE